MFCYVMYHSISSTNLCSKSVASRRVSISGITNGFVQSPILLIFVLIIFALGAMLIMVSIDKLLNPLWDRLIAFAAKYDEKWNTKQLR